MSLLWIVVMLFFKDASIAKHLKDKLWQTIKFKDRFTFCQLCINTHNQNLVQSAHLFSVFVSLQICSEGTGRKRGNITEKTTNFSRYNFTCLPYVNFQWTNRHVKVVLRQTWRVTLSLKLENHTQLFHLSFTASLNI